MVFTPSRTPEGDANTCPICGKEVRVEASSFPSPDAPCPHCGYLLWFDQSEDLAKELLRISPFYEQFLLKAGELLLGPTNAELHGRFMTTLDNMTQNGNLPPRSITLKWIVDAKDWESAIEVFESHAMEKAVNRQTFISQIKKAIRKLFTKVPS